MKAILVTGGAGYIGSHIIELLLKKNLKLLLLIIYQLAIKD
jgi:nucleoside-diphosphate-sugar epimerase